MAHDLPHRLLADRLRGAGFRLRPARRAGRFAGALAARHAGVQPDAAARGEGAAGEVSAGDAAAGRRAGHQRSVALRRPPVRHRRGDAGVPQRRAGGADRHRRPCRRYRRHQGQSARARDLRGRHPDPADDAVSRGRAERRPVHADRRERAQERGGAGRHPLLHRRQRARRRTAAGIHGRIRHARSARARACGADARRERDARGDPRAAGRRVSLGDLEQPAGRDAELSAEADRAGRCDRARFRRRAGAVAAGRTELHLLLHRGARDLSDEVHAQRRRCAAMPAATGRSP